jgi:hypothetical protein
MEHAGTAEMQSAPRNRYSRHIHSAEQRLARAHPNARRWTIDTRRYALDKWMYPFFGDKLLANSHNVAMKEFVDHIADLSPATIRDYVLRRFSKVTHSRSPELIHSLEN